MVGSAVLAVFLLVFGVGGVLVGRAILVERNDSSFIRGVAKVTHFPVARVGSNVITYQEYLVQADAQRTYLQGKEATTLGVGGTPTSEMQQSVYDQLIRIAATEEIAKKYDFQVTQLDVDRAYDELIGQAGTSTKPGEVQAYLQENFGWNEPQFKEYIIRPALLKNGLVEKLKQATGKDDAFETELSQRITASDVHRWLRFN